MNTPKVSVLCTTYNQSKYIEQCLKSLLNQITDFDYEIIVHDDASTDGTTDILNEYKKRYKDKIVLILQKKNQYSQHVNIDATYLLPKAKGEYIALCEGDDFWTDSYKLQRQYEFMEKNKEYSLCAHAGYYADENGEIINDKTFMPFNKSRTVTMEQVLTGWNFPTNSLFIRRESYGDGVVPFRGDCANGDYALTVYLATKGKIYYMSELMSAYRLNSVGSLNWVWRHNPQKYIDVRTKYISMLDRIDAYTDKEYHDCIDDYKHAVEFELALFKGDYPTAVKDRKRYKDLSTLERLKLMIKYRLPSVVCFARKWRSK